jgi:hypothetical protein
MTELRRWSEEGATEDELRLLEESRSERASPASRARIAGAIGAGAALTAVSTTGAATAATATTSGGLATVWKLAGVVALVGAGAGVAEQWSAPRADAPAKTNASAKVREPAESRVVAPPAAAPEAPPSATAEAPKPAPVRARPAGAASGSLPRELASLERARQALASDAPERALAELENHKKRFPNGELAAESTILRVQTLLAQGRTAEAVALADQFAAAHPDSPYARRVQALVKTAKPKP